MYVKAFAAVTAAAVENDHGIEALEIEPHDGRVETDNGMDSDEDLQFSFDMDP